jgi:hypothetical protein
MKMRALPCVRNHQNSSRADRKLLNPALAAAGHNHITYTCKHSSRDYNMSAE